MASGGRSPPPLWRHRPVTDAHRPTARGSGGDDVGRTFGRLGDLDDTSHANQERDSASRAVKPASTQTPAGPPFRQAGGVQGAHQRAKLALVFPGERGTPFSGWSKAKSALDTASGVSGWWLHDLRRTLATGLQRLGVRLEVTEAVLNHLSGSRAGVVGIYQRHDWAEEKRAALDAWSAHLLAAAEGRLPAGKVLPFSRAGSAQSDRALPSEGRGHKFESCRARQRINGLTGPFVDRAAPSYPVATKFSKKASSDVPPCKQPSGVHARSARARLRATPARHAPRWPAGERAAHRAR